MSYACLITTPVLKRAKLCRFAKVNDLAKASDCDNKCGRTVRINQAERYWWIIHANLVICILSSFIYAYIQLSTVSFVCFSPTLVKLKALSELLFLTRVRISQRCMYTYHRTEFNHVEKFSSELESLHALEVREPQNDVQ